MVRARRWTRGRLPLVALTVLWIAASTAPSPAAADARLEHGLERVPGSFILTFDPAIPQGRAAGLAAASGGRVGREYFLGPTRVQVTDVPPGMERDLERLPGVRRVTPDYRVGLFLAQSTPLVGALATNPGLQNTDGGLGINVCLVDTGIYPVHTLFDDDNNLETPSQRIRAWKDFVHDESVPYDDHGHGTHMAGIIFGRIGIQVGGLPYQGMAPRARIYVAKVIGGQGAGTFSNVQAAIEWCAGFAPDSPFPPADVINLSLGAGEFSGICDTDDPTGTAPVLNAAAASGVLIVAASGNEARRDAVATPACASGAMAVGSTQDRDEGGLSYGVCEDEVTAPDRLNCYSNRWDFLDVVAPGCFIHSGSIITPSLLVPGCGTSMSAAVVSGLGALVMAANRTMPAAAVRERIRSTALDLGAPGFDRAHGHGRVDAYYAVNGPICFPDENPESSCGDGADNDCDRRTDCADPDCCTQAPCNLVDADQDGFGTCDCDDGEPLAWAVPGEVSGLTLEPGEGGATALSWSAPAAPGGAVLAYDLLRATDPADFLSAVCLESQDAGDSMAVDAGPPAPGEIFFYLVRVAGGCAIPGTLGGDADGVERLGRICP
jgi:hypothetical protein